jgi:hypothetical protein
MVNLNEHVHQVRFAQLQSGRAYKERDKSCYRPGNAIQAFYAMDSLMPIYGMCLRLTHERIKVDMVLLGKMGAVKCNITLALPLVNT